MSTFIQFGLHVKSSNYQGNRPFFQQLKCISVGLLLFSASGCSVVDGFHTPQPQAKHLPKMPEIKRQTVTVPPKKVTRARNVPAQRVVKSRSRIITHQEKKAIEQLLKQQTKERATINMDPYATVPESSSQNSVNRNVNMKSTNRTRNSSPAVTSLMVGARADLALGKNSSAVSKLERGLRIDSQNPELWYLLAKAHYLDSDYGQSISMAKKSIRYSNDDSLIAQNWRLIKKAGEKSGDSIAIKEALDYIRLNP